MWFFIFFFFFFFWNYSPNQNNFHTFFLLELFFSSTSSYALSALLRKSMMGSSAGDGGWLLEAIATMAAPSSVVITVLFAVHVWSPPLLAVWERVWRRGVGASEFWLRESLICLSLHVLHRPVSLSNRTKFRFVCLHLVLRQCCVGANSVGAGGKRIFWILN